MGFWKNRTAGGPVAAEEHKGLGFKSQLLQWRLFWDVERAQKAGAAKFGARNKGGRNGMSMLASII